MGHKYGYPSKGNGNELHQQCGGFLTQLPGKVKGFLDSAIEKCKDLGYANGSKKVKKPLNHLLVTL